MNANENLVRLAKDSKSKITLEYYPEEVLTITVEKGGFKEKVTINNSRSYYTDSFIICGIRNLIDECVKQEEDLYL